VVIALRPVTAENFPGCLRLKVAPEQERFVAPNVYSIAQAYVAPDMTPLAIYEGDDVVGFAMYGHDAPTDRWWIVRIMIGAEHQGKGLGRAALQALVALLSARHECNAVYLGYVPGNGIAERLYARLGFVPTGEIEDGEIVARRDLADRR
jgi:diamine N-acetyltransferase